MHLHNGYFNVFRLMIIFRRWLKSNINVQFQAGAETAEVQHAAIIAKRRWSLCDGWITMLLYKLSLKRPLIWMGHLVFSLLGPWLKFKVILTRLESWIYTVQTLGYRETGIPSLHLPKSLATLIVVNILSHQEALEQCFLIEAALNGVWRHLLLNLNYAVNELWIDLRFLDILTLCSWYWGPCWHGLVRSPSTPMICLRFVTFKGI